MAFSAEKKKQLYHKKHLLNYPRGGWRANCIWLDVGLETRVVQGAFLLWAGICMMLESMTCLKRKASRPLCLLREKKEYIVFLFRQKLI